MRRPPEPPHQPRQRGAAVILALLTVALVAGLAAAAVGDLGVAMDQVTGRHDQAQARQLARGAVDWARNVLAEDARGSTVDHLGEAWAVQVPPTPVEEGELAGEIRELSGRLNLNNLVQLDGPDALEIEQFQRLLASVGVGDAEAISLTAALLDWLDADDEPRLPGGAESSWYGAQTPPRRAANSPLAAVAELTQIRGFSPALVARLSPSSRPCPPAAGSTSTPPRPRCWSPRPRPRPRHRPGAGGRARPRLVQGRGRLRGPPQVAQPRRQPRHLAPGHHQPPLPRHRPRPLRRGHGAHGSAPRPQPELAHHRLAETAMSHRLLLAIDEQWPTRPDCPWVLLGPDGQPAAEGHSEPRHWPAAAECEVVLTGPQCLWLEVPLPRAKRSDLPRLLAYALEDRLLKDPDTQHLTVSHRRPAGDGERDSPACWSSPASACARSRPARRHRPPAAPGAGRGADRTGRRRGLAAQPVGGRRDPAQQREAGIALDADILAPLLAAQAATARAANTAPSHVALHLAPAARPRPRALQAEAALDIRPAALPVVAGRRRKAANLLHGEFAFREQGGGWLAGWPGGLGRRRGAGPVVRGRRG
jgi:hypothetical protein